jgi:hypothetical protein
VFLTGVFLFRVYSAANSVGSLRLGAVLTVVRDPWDGEALRPCLEGVEALLLLTPGTDNRAEMVGSLVVQGFMRVMMTRVGIRIRMTMRTMMMMVVMLTI